MGDQRRTWCALAHWMRVRGENDSTNPEHDGRWSFGSISILSEHDLGFDEIVENLSVNRVFDGRWSDVTDIAAETLREHGYINGRTATGLLNAIAEENEPWSAPTKETAND